jgi:peptidoglycan/LPS O-acetylase OafA/YrhL
MLLSSRLTGAERMPLIDALKAVASQLIVLHHLAFYGPLSDAANSLAPTLIGWLSHHARIAVQVFLVVAGFLAAQRLAPTGAPQVAHPLAIVGHRYWRLVAPYLVALSIAITGAAIARIWLQHDSIPDVPTLPQVIAHVLLLQNILSYDALSAGAWYVAIDFQLFTATVLVLWLAQRLGQRTGTGRRYAVIALSALALASLLHFNLDAHWDIWAVYFFGAYAAGALAYWGAASKRSAVWLVVLLVAGLAVLTINTRPHTIVALATALALGIGRRAGVVHRLPSPKIIGSLGRISYSVFLVHFPVCLVVNALFNHVAPGNPLIGALGMVVAWGASVAAGALFHHYVEYPVAGFFSVRARRPAASVPGRRGQPVPNRG